jgi:hypothetical protein
MCKRQRIGKGCRNKFDALPRLNMNTWERQCHSSRHMYSNDGSKCYSPTILSWQLRRRLGRVHSHKFIWGKVVPELNLAPLGNRGIASGILNLGTRWRWVVSFKPQPLYPRGKNTRYPFDRRLGGPQSRSGRGREEKQTQPLLGLEPPDVQQGR